MAGLAATPTGRRIAEQVPVSYTHLDVYKRQAYKLLDVPGLGVVSALQVIALGILFALLSIFFCRLMHATPKLYQKYLPRPVVRAAVGGAIVIALSLIHISSLAVAMPQGTPSSASLVRRASAPGFSGTFSRFSTWTAR